MKEYKFNGHALEVYDSIQDIPVTRFQQFNLNVMIESGIGSDLSSYDQHTNSIIRMIQSGKSEDAIKELRNRQQNLHFIMNNVSPKMTAFAAVLHRLNGRIIQESELNEEGIKKIIEELGSVKVSVSFVDKILSAVKKKIEFETEQFFPNLIDDSSSKEFYTKLKLRTMYVLDGVVNGIEKFEEKIKDLESTIFSMIKPKVYHGHQGLEVQMITNFENTCTLLEFHNLSSDPKKLSALAFLTKTISLKQLLKKNKKSNR